MGMSKYDWTAIQKYYDAGNSWRKVQTKFGIYNLSIQNAVKRGDLVSRDRQVAATIAHRDSLKEHASCLGCSKEFVFRPANRRGKFCSNICQGKYRWDAETIPRILAGEAGEQTVKKYLLLNDPFCKICRMDTWMDKPITLQLDHIDGNSDDNSIGNVRLLCPNCHSQTETFGFKNRGRFTTRRGVKRALLRSQ